MSDRHSDVSDDEEANVLQGLDDILNSDLALRSPAERHSFAAFPTPADSFRSDIGKRQKALSKTKQHRKDTKIKKIK